MKPRQPGEMMNNAHPVAFFRRTFVCTLLLIAPAARAADARPAAPSPAPAPQQPATTAIDAAKDYTDKLKSSQPTEALRLYWDMDAMLSGIFGEHLRRHTDTERAEVQAILLRFMEKVYADPKVADAMRQATFDQFKSDEGQPRGTTTVTFNLRLQDTMIRNTLLMKQVDGKWRIHDAGANGRMMVPALKAQYEPQAQRVTPLEYIKAMVAQMPGDKKN